MTPCMQWQIARRSNGVSLLTADQFRSELHQELAKADRTDGRFSLLIAILASPTMRRQGMRAGNAET